MKIALDSSNFFRKGNFDMKAFTQKVTLSRIKSIFRAFLVIFIFIVFSSQSVSAAASKNETLNELLQELRARSEITLKNISQLPGRYAVSQPIPSVDPNSKTHVSAASNIILEISKPNKKGVYTFTYDRGIDGLNDKKISKVQMKLEKKNNVPIFYDVKDKKKSRKGIYLSFGNELKNWVLFDERNEKASGLHRLNSEWYPSGFLNGEWQEKITGATFTFTDDTMKLVTGSGELIGKYVLKDNRMFFNFPSGAEGLYYVAYDPRTDQLALTKIANDRLLRAMSLERTGRTERAPIYSQMPNYTQAQSYEEDMFPGRYGFYDVDYSFNYYFQDDGQYTSEAVINTDAITESGIYEISGNTLTVTTLSSQYRGKTDNKIEKIVYKIDRANKAIVREDGLTFYKIRSATSLPPAPEANYRSEATQTQTPSLPDSGQESNSEDETFSGRFESHINGASAVIRFMENGQFISENKIEGVSTTTTTTGKYRLNGNVITLYNIFNSINDSAPIESFGTMKIKVDRQNNFLYIDEAEPGEVMRAVGVPTWKRK